MENYKHKNIAEPLKVFMDLGHGYSGESFIITFFSGKSGVSSFTCKYNAETGMYQNCEKVTDKSVLCVIPPRTLMEGVLKCKTTFKVEDWHMAQGVQDLSETKEVEINLHGKVFGIEMINGASDAFTLNGVTLSVLPLITKGKDGKTKWADLTEDEKKEVAALLPSALLENKPACGIVKVGEGLILSPNGTLSIDWAYARRRLGYIERKGKSSISTTI